MKSRSFKSQIGFTLIDVLLSITILSIIFISFLALFPQSTKFNDKNADELSAVTIAMDQLELAKKLKFEELQITDVTQSEEKDEILTRVNKLTTKITMYKTKTDLLPSVSANKIALYQIKVEVYDSSSNKLTEIFGYRY